MLKLQASNGKIDLHGNNGSIAVKVPIQQSGDSDTVKYIPQTLTDAQKAQARDNINALDKYNGFMPTTLAFPNIFGGSEPTELLRYTNSQINMPDVSTATEEIKNALFKFYILLTGTRTNPTVAAKDGLGIAPLIGAGVFGEDFWNTYTYENSLIIQDAPIAPHYIFQLYVYNQTKKQYAIITSTSMGYRCSMVCPLEGQTINIISLKLEPISRVTYTMDKTPTAPQFELSAAPTKDMQVATKKYVDDGLATKQDTLTAGTNISIENGVISAAGGVSGYAFHSNQTLSEEDKAHLKQIYDNRNIHMSIDGLTVIRMMSLATKWGFVVINTNGAMSNRVLVYSVNIDSNGNVTSDKFALIMSYYLVGNSNMVSGEVLTSNNWNQYISVGGGGDWQYTGNASDSSLYNAKEMVLYWYDTNNIKHQSYLNFTANFNGDLEQTLGTGWANEEIRLDADDTINYPSVTYNGSALTAANCTIGYIVYK